MRTSSFNPIGLFLFLGLLYSCASPPERAPQSVTQKPKASDLEPYLGSWIHSCCTTTSRFVVSQNEQGETHAHFHDWGSYGKNFEARIETLPQGLLLHGTDQQLYRVQRRQQDPTKLDFIRVGDATTFATLYREKQQLKPHHILGPWKSETNPNSRIHISRGSQGSPLVALLQGWEQYSNLVRHPVRIVNDHVLIFATEEGAPITLTPKLAQRKLAQTGEPTEILRMGLSLPTASGESGVLLRDEGWKLSPKSLAGSWQHNCCAQTNRIRFVTKKNGSLEAEFKDWNRYGNDFRRKAEILHGTIVIHMQEDDSMSLVADPSDPNRLEVIRGGSEGRTSSGLLLRQP